MATVAGNVRAKARVTIPVPEDMTRLHTLETAREVLREGLEHHRDKESIVKFGHVACK